MPMGLGYVATSLDEADFKIQIHDMNILGTTPKQVARLIAENSISIVGITGFITQVGHIINLINQIKSSTPEVKILVGGSLLNGVEKYLFNESQVDIVVRGEGEKTTVDLLSGLIGAGEIPDIPGIAYRKGNRIISHPGKGFVKDLDSISMLNRDHFEVEKYIDHYYHSSVNTRTLEIIWSRGCPYKCTFCINSTNDGGYRARSVDKVVDEIGYIKEKYNVTDVVIASEVFTVNKARTLEFCNKVTSLNLTWSCFTRADLLSDEMLGSMKEAGCRQIFAGIEAADNELLDKMNKKVTIEKIKDGINMIKKYNIEVRGGMIAGLPWETPATMKKARDFCLENKLIYWPTFSSAFPNTLLYEKVRHLIADEKKYIRSLTNHHNMKSYLLNMTQMSTKTFLGLKNKYTAETMAEILHAENPHLPKFIIRLGTRVMLFFYHLDYIWGMDVHSFIHRLLRKIYVLLTSNYLIKRHKAATKK